MSKPRLLFASIHSYLDPSSGAAMASREVLELLAARGWDCRALACGVLDYQRETPLDEVMTTLDLPTRRASAALSRGGCAEVIDLELGAVRVTLLPTTSSRAEKSPNPREGAMFLDLATQVFDRFRPDVLLTYGGHPASLELMRRARARQIAVVFHLHNFGYNDRRGFADVSAVIFPSEYSRRFHQGRIGLDGVVIPDPIRLDRVIAEDPEPTYATLINPQPDKGVTVFAAIALELGRRRPEIPLLVVEGRGTSKGLASLPVDLSGLANLNRMANTGVLKIRVFPSFRFPPLLFRTAENGRKTANWSAAQQEWRERKTKLGIVFSTAQANTPDPRDFYRVSRVALMPSIWRESLGRVPIEAMANGIPVLASDRGALPETLGASGFVFTIPDRCTPGSGAIPTAREVAPWVAVIERLWDDPEFEARHRALARAEAQRWDWERVAEKYQRFFEDFVHDATNPPCEARCRGWRRPVLES